MGASMFKLTAAEQQRIAINVIRKIAHERFQRLEYTEGRDYAVLDLRANIQDAIEANNPIRQRAYTALLNDIE
jgi:hypothetical protein